MLRALPEAATELLARQHGVATSAQLRSVGLSKSTLTTAVRQQLLLNPHRGIYVDRFAWRVASESVRHAMRLLAVQLVAPDAIGTGPTAATAWAVPVRRIPDRPLVARSPDSSRVAGATLTRRRVPDDAIAVAEGLRVTKLAPTVVSIAATSRLADALITADAALRRGVGHDELLRNLEQLAHATDRSRAEPVIAHADPWSESWLESLSRGQMIELGMPVPLCNVTLIEGGREVRVDDLWAELGVIGESDGRGKYDDRRGGAGEAHWREKRRHEWLQELGFEIARWGTEEVVPSGVPMRRRFDRAAQRQMAVGFTWPSGVRAEIRGIPGATPPSRVTLEVRRLRELGIPICLTEPQPWRVPDEPRSIWTPRRDERSVSRDFAASPGQEP